jgi:hypothetical protein
MASSESSDRPPRRGGWEASLPFDRARTDMGNEARPTKKLNAACRATWVPSVAVVDKIVPVEARPMIERMTSSDSPRSPSPHGSGCRRGARPPW